MELFYDILKQLNIIVYQGIAFFTAPEEDIKYHFKDAYLKNKMTQSVIKGSLATNGKIQGTTLQLPIIGYHTVNKAPSIKAVDSMIIILKRLYVDVT